MTIIRDMIGYSTSRDYPRLWELAKTQGVICIVKYNDQVRDIAHTLYNRDTLSVSARGTCYLMAWEMEDFIRQCEAAELEWVVPDSCRNSDEELLDLYRKKRSVDGLNGRPWDASRHLEYETRIEKMEKRKKDIRPCRDLYTKMQKPLKKAANGIPGTGMEKKRPE